MEGSTAANHAAGIRPQGRRVPDGTAPRMGPMTAIIYFGEIPVARNRPASNFAAQNEF
jgi:hypothetical protein